MRSIPRLACAIGAAVATSAAAQTYPAKPITLVNAFWAEVVAGVGIKPE